MCVNNVVFRPLFLANLARSLVNARQIDLGDELHGRGSIWIIVAAVNVQAVDTILVGALWEELSVKPLVSEPPAL